MYYFEHFADREVYVLFFNVILLQFIFFILIHIPFCKRHTERIHLTLNLKIEFYSHWLQIDLFKGELTNDPEHYTNQNYFYAKIQNFTSTLFFDFI